MRILVMESAPGEALAAEAELTAAGHDIVHCHEDRARAFPCKGVEGSVPCPLADEPVDVALIVRDPLGVAVTPWEKGVTCALRARVPVVAEAGAMGNPYGDYVVIAGDDLAQSLAAVATGGRVRHAEAVRSYLLSMSAFSGIEPDDLVVTATMSAGRLRLFVRLPEDVGPTARTAVMSRAALAARRYDPTCRTIEVLLS